MSLPSFTATAKPTTRAARRAARNRAQTLVELIGADSGQYPTQQEIDERVNAWADHVIPDADLTPPATVISNRASTRECHGFTNPCGLRSWVVTGTGTGWQIVTPAKPVPVARV